MLAYGTLITFNQFKEFLLKNDPKFFDNEDDFAYGIPTAKRPIALIDLEPTVFGLVNKRSEMATFRSLPISKTDIEIFINGCCEGSTSKSKPYVIGWSGNDPLCGTIRAKFVTKRKAQLIKDFCEANGWEKPCYWQINDECYHCHTG